MKEQVSDHNASRLRFVTHGRVRATPYGLELALKKLRFAIARQN